MMTREKNFFLFSYLTAVASDGLGILHSALAKLSPFMHIASASALVMDADTGELIYRKSENRPLYPASTTKVMTSLLMAEYAKAHSWNELVVMSGEALKDIGPDATNIGLKPGDSLSLRECLYAILLASANDVCAGVAEHIAGTVNEFSNIMNKRAGELGANSTFFVNPHGLPNKRHITTAGDIARIMKGAIGEPDVLKALQTAKYVIYPNGVNGPGLVLRNKNRLIQDGPYHRDYVVGGKTGYTRAARHTLVNYAVRDGVRLICVAMRAPNNMTYTDTITLFEYGFSKFLRKPSAQPAGGLDKTYGFNDQNLDPLADLWMHR